MKLIRAISGQVFVRLGLALLLAMISCSVTFAQVALTWSADGSGGSGAWDAGITADWFNGSAVVWPATSSGGDTASFAGTAGAVSIDSGGVAATALYFTADGYNLGGSGVLALDGSLTIPKIEAASGVNATISSTMAGTNGFYKSNVGKLILTGTNTFSGNIYFGDPTTQGTTRPASGVLQITQAAALGVLGNNVNNGVTNQIVQIRDNGDTLELNGASGNIVLSNYVGFVTSGTNQIRNVAGTNTINGQLLLSTGVGDTGISSDGGSLTLAGPINVGSSARSLVLLGTNSAVNTVSGVISNASNGALTGLKKTGPNTWLIMGTNTYGGQTVFGIRNGADGILRLGNSSALGTSNLLVTGGSQSGRVEFTGGITITNAIILEGRSSGNTRAISSLSGTNTLTGSITGVSGSGNAFNIESQAGFLTVQGGFSQTYSVGRGVFLLGAGDGLYSGNIVNGSGTALTKRGAGTWTISGTNSHADPTTIEAGRLQFAKQVSLYSNNPASWGATNIKVSASATAAFNVGGAGEFTAGDIAALAALGTPTNGFMTGSILGLDTANAGSDFLYGSNLNNPNGTNILGLTKLGSNRLTLSGTNNFTGNVTISGGQLRIANAHALDTATNRTIFATASAPLELDGTSGDITLSTSNSLQTSGAVINNVGGNNRINGSIFMTTGVGGTTISSSGGALTLAGIINSSTTRSLSLIGNSTGTNTVSGSIQDGTTPGNPNPVIKTGAGTWILAGNNTYTGSTTISQGILSITGSLTNSAVTNIGGTLTGTGVINGPVVIASGTLNPGVSTNLGETLTINNDLTLNGTALVQIGKSGLTPVNDAVVGVTNINYGGTLIVTNATGATIVAGDAFGLFSASGIKSGNFTSVVVQPPVAGLTNTFNPATGTLTFSSLVVTPPTLAFTNNGGGSLQFSWTGSFKLQSQTNTLSTGLGTNWGDYPGGGSSPVNVTLDPTKGSVFFRLAQP